MSCRLPAICYVQLQQLRLHDIHWHQMQLRCSGSLSSPGLLQQSSDRCMRRFTKETAVCPNAASRLITNTWKCDHPHLCCVIIGFRSTSELFSKPPLSQAAMPYIKLNKRVTIANAEYILDSQTLADSRVWKGWSHIASTEREPTMRSGGFAPSGSRDKAVKGLRGQGQSPLKLNVFL